MRETRSCFRGMLLAVVTAAAVGCGGEDTPAGPSATAPGAGGQIPVTQAYDGNGPSGPNAPGGGAGGHARLAAGASGDSGSTTPESPGDVTNLAGVQREGENAVDLSWNPPTTGGDAGWYEATRESYDTQTVQASACTTEGGTTTCGVTFRHLTHDPHRFSVVARNAGGRSRGVGVQVTVTESTVALPGAVSGLAGSQASGTTDVTLTWSAPSDSVVDSYSVSGPGSQSYTISASACGDTGCSQTFTSVGAGTHSFSVAAVNSAGTGTASSVTVTVTEASAPSAITGLSGEQVELLNHAKLTWNHDETATSYEVVASSGTVRETVAAAGCSTTCTVTIDYLTFGTYVFEVTAVNAAGSSTASSVTVTLVEPFTASVSNVPASHGNADFGFRLTFSENFSVSYRRIRDHAFTVSGGTVRRAQRARRGSNEGWNITVRPDDGATVHMVLQKPDSCSGNAICNNGGLPQSADVTVTVRP